MPAPKHSPEEKAKALKLYKEEGLVKAAAETGIPEGTISSWAHRKGVQTSAPENLRAAIETSVLSRELRKERMIDSMLVEAQAALDDLREPYVSIVRHKDGTSEIVELKPDPSDRAKLSTSYGILFDKIQLATGGPTQNTQSLGKDEVAAFMLGARTAFDVAEQKAEAGKQPV